MFIAQLCKPETVCKCRGHLRAKNQMQPLINENPLMLHNNFKLVLV